MGLFELIGVCKSQSVAHIGQLGVHKGHFRVHRIIGNSFGLICHMIWGLIQASSENKLGNLYGPLQVSCGPLKGSCGPLADSHKPLRDSYGPSDDSCGLFRSLFQPFKQ